MGKGVVMGKAAVVDEEVIENGTGIGRIIERR